MEIEESHLRNSPRLISDAIPFSMPVFIKISIAIFSLILILSAVGHLVSPEVSSGFIPDFLPETPVHIATAIVEAILGLGLFFPTYRKMAFLGIVVLMLAFLPLHVNDIFQEVPIIGTHTAAIVRVIIQVGLVTLAWMSWKQTPNESR